MSGRSNIASKPITLSSSEMRVGPFLSNSDLFTLLIYTILGVLIALGILFIAFVTASYSKIDFPSTNDGIYGFIMLDVINRVPLSTSGGGYVTQPPYNPNYTTFKISSGAPINPLAYLGGQTNGKPISTSRWWSRMASQKSPTSYTPDMPYTYTGVFSFYRSIAAPSFGISITRPYSLFEQPIEASNNCGQTMAGLFRSLSWRVSDGAPTFFMAPAVWDTLYSLPVIPDGVNAILNVYETNNMSASLNYTSSIGMSFNMKITQLSPYLVLHINRQSSICINTYLRDNIIPGGNPSWSVIPLTDLMNVIPVPVETGVTLKKYETQVVSPVYVGRLPPVGESQTSMVRFTISFNNPVTITTMPSGEIIVTADFATDLFILPTRYYIADPLIPTNPTNWVNLTSDVENFILSARPVTTLKGVFSSTITRDNKCIISYITDDNKPLIFIPSISMRDVGMIVDATPIPSATDEGNFWLTQQGPCKIYVASSGTLNVKYPLIDPPPTGSFDIYNGFDAWSTERLSRLFAMDLQTLQDLNPDTDTFEEYVRKMFGFAQLSNAVYNYPASSVTNVYLPGLTKSLFNAMDVLMTSKRIGLRLGFNNQLNMVSPEISTYGESQNISFGDNHIVLYGLILMTYFILVNMQQTNSARRYTIDRYQSIMVDLLRDFAQPYDTDNYIPHLRHFDYGIGLSFQTSSITGMTSLNSGEILYGYYAAWLCSQLWGDKNLTNFYRAILSIEMVTHRQYKLTPLLSNGIVPTYSSVIAAIDRASSLFINCGTKVEHSLASPAFFKTYGSAVLLLYCGEVIIHSVRTQHPDDTYLVNYKHPNTVGDYAVNSFIRPVNPLMDQYLPTEYGASLNTFMTNVFVQNAGFTTTSLAVGIQRPISIDHTVSLYITAQAAYSLSGYARTYVETNYWPGANLPENTCAIIPSSEIPYYLEFYMQYNRLGPMDTNSQLWMWYITKAYGS